MASMLEQRFNHTVREALTLTLKPRGFRKRGRVFRRQLEGLAWIIDVQRSQWNTWEEIRFTINCGVYVPRVLSIYANLPEPASPTNVHCCVRARIGMLAQDQQDRWWTLTGYSETTQADAQIIADIQTRIVHQALPFLNQFPSILEIAEYLKGADTYNSICAGIIYMIRGEQETGRDLLAQAAEAAKGTRAEEHIQRLVQRLILSGLNN